MRNSSIIHGSIRGGRFSSGAEDYADRYIRRLCAGRQGGLPVQRIDERDPGKSGRRGKGNHDDAPDAAGEVYAGTLVAADIAGVDEIYKVGGAQAVAAMAFGTKSIPKVDKITGPGNIFVALAKKHASAM